MACTFQKFPRFIYFSGESPVNAIEASDENLSAEFILLKMSPNLNGLIVDYHFCLQKIPGTLFQIFL